MKKMKKIICLVLSLALILGVPVNAQAASPADQAYSAYSRFVARNIRSPKYVDPKYTYFDINRDGISELIVEYAAGVRGGCAMFTYYGGKVCKLHKNFLGCGKIGRYGNYITVSQSSGAADSSITAFTMSGNKLKKVAVYRDYYEQYYRNGKKISEAKFTEFVSKIKDLPPASGNSAESSKMAHDACNFVIGKSFRVMGGQQMIRFTDQDQCIVSGSNGNDGQYSYSFYGEYTNYRGVWMNLLYIVIDNWDYRFSIEEGRIIYLGGGGVFEGTYELI